MPKRKYLCVRRMAWIACYRSSEQRFNAFDRTGHVPERTLCYGIQTRAKMACRYFSRQDATKDSG